MVLLCCCGTPDNEAPPVVQITEQASDTAEPAITKKVVTKPQTKYTETAKPKKTKVYYANCDAVRAAGKDPLFKGQPGYAAKLDANSDGVACEED